MGNMHSSLVSLFKGLAERITSSQHPKWPITIFEAESYLYRHFMRKLLVILDTLIEQGKSWCSIATLFRTPSRVTEFCYLFLGVRFSDLDSAERLRLASHLIHVLSCLRPEDTFCEQGTNRLVDKNKIDSVVSDQSVLKTSRKRGVLSRLVAALFSMSEFVHVGIPQYGREVHGPYKVDSEHFVLIRSYFDLRLVKIWPFLESFLFDEIEIVQTYAGTPNLVRFDLTNHMTSSVALHERLKKAVVRVKSQGRVELVSDWDHLLEGILNTTDEYFRLCKGFKRSDWLCKHLEARHLYLKPHADMASLSWKPTPQEYEHLDDDPFLYFELQDLLSGSFDDIFNQMCLDYNITTNKIDELH